MNTISFHLASEPQGLTLVCQEAAAKRPSRLRVEFTQGPLAYRRVHGGGKNQAIAKAVGLKHYPLPFRVMDVTAGWGRDAFVLASLGCTLHLIEQSPIIGALLEDGLRRASADPMIGSWVSAMKLSVAKAEDILNVLEERDYPEVIYLDPMFPDAEGSALHTVRMRVLREIVKDFERSDTLLALARSKAQKRVVVKRPKQAEPLDDQVPDFAIHSVSHRYDVYLSR
jgi:16S rRNA (guanine1516-N2)-methyltransferase